MKHILQVLAADTVQAVQRSVFYSFERSFECCDAVVHRVLVEETTLSTTGANHGGRVHEDAAAQRHADSPVGFFVNFGCLIGNLTVLDLRVQSDLRTKNKLVRRSLQPLP